MNEKYIVDVPDSAVDKRETLLSGLAVALVTSRQRVRAGCYMVTLQRADYLKKCPEHNAARAKDRSEYQCGCRLVVSLKECGCVSSDEIEKSFPSVEDFVSPEANQGFKEWVGKKVPT